MDLIIHKRISSCVGRPYRRCTSVLSGIREITAENPVSDLEGFKKKTEPAGAGGLGKKKDFAGYFRAALIFFAASGVTHVVQLSL